MDYEKLIWQLRCRACNAEAEEQAATAIGTLLAERDTAIEMLNGHCFACKHFGVDKSDEPCHSCGDGKQGTTNRWEWEGSKEHKNDK